ncbi:MAG: hypothetical protein JWN19_2411, partial [Arthrobacter sp.]|nr:hypothetical protein [Arthrobacter sp.]
GSVPERRPSGPTDSSGLLNENVFLVQGHPGRQSSSRPDQAHRRTGPPHAWPRYTKLAPTLRQNLGPKVTNASCTEASRVLRRGEPRRRPEPRDDLTEGHRGVAVARDRRRDRCSVIVGAGPVGNNQLLAAIVLPAASRIPEAGPCTSGRKQRSVRVQGRTPGLLPSSLPAETGLPAGSVISRRYT